MANCRSCGAEVIWTITQRGKKMPIDVGPDDSGNVTIEQKVDPNDGKDKWYSTVHRDGVVTDSTTYTSHFKTCPNADQHRGNDNQQQASKAKEQPVAKQQQGSGDILRYKDLLEMAHEKGIARLEALPEQLPEESNGFYAAAVATLEMKDGRIFSDMGDASPGSVQRTIVPHLLRMAATRAKARCLRDALNYGDPVLEEFEGSDMREATDTPPARKQTYTQPAPAQDDGFDASDEMREAMGDDEETHDSVRNDIITLIKNAPASKKDELPTVEQAMEYADKSKEYAIATRQRINNKLRGGDKVAR
jgi:hypothetical protein